jgi:transposase
MSNTILGVDISKATIDVAILNGSKHLQVFSNDQQGFEELQKWLETHTQEKVHACMEATGQYGYPLATYLHQQKHRVSVVNPARIKAYRQTRMYRNKTDRLDAMLIADFCLTQRPGLWEPPKREYEQLQALTRHLDALKGMLQQEKNRLHAGIASEYVLEQIKGHIEYIKGQINELEDVIEELIGQNTQMKKEYDLLQSIPGIGFQTAIRLIAEIKEISTFSNAGQLAAYAGVTPRQYSSGTSVRRRSLMSKTGNANLRRALYMPAIVAKRCNPVISTFCGRLIERGKPPKVAIGAAMRKMLHIVYGVLKSGKPFDPNYGMCEICP